MNLESFTIRPIGIIRTPYRERSQAPRQPGAEGRWDQGVIELAPKRNFEQALEDLAGFERIWLLSWFHLNPNWKPKILPPRGSKRKRGVFGTRSPYRPNPIGLSLVELLEVSGRTLRVGGVDLLDNTPILDIKPYIPYAEAFPDARVGWLEAVAGDPERAQPEKYTLSWSRRAMNQADFLRERHGIEIKATAERVLAQDPAPHPYRRISQHSTGLLQLAVRSWRVLFEVHGRNLRVQRLASGYPAAELAAAPPDTLHDHAAHLAFERCWPS